MKLLRTSLCFWVLVSLAVLGCSAEVVGEEEPGTSAEALSGSFPVGTELRTTADVNHRREPSTSAEILQVIPPGTAVKSAAAQPRAGWYGITWNGKTGWVAGQYLSRPAPQGSGAAALLAYHASGDVTLWDETFGRKDGADPLSNIRDAAAGRGARTSCYGTAPCTRVQLSSKLVSSMVELRQRYEYRYFVTAISGASHSSGSYHYAGRAMDIDTINGVRINGNTSLTRGFMSACSALGAIEVLGPSNRSDHQDHIHCAW